MPKPQESSRGSARTFTATATAYGPPDFPAGQRTASGRPVGSGCIAVDTRIIPLGTKLFVEGYGEGVACDTGGAIKGYIIDVWLDSYEKCTQWGRRQVKVEILP